MGSQKGSVGAGKHDAVGIDQDDPPGAHRTDHSRTGGEEGVDAFPGVVAAIIGRQLPLEEVGRHHSAPEHGAAHFPRGGSSGEEGHRHDGGQEKKAKGQQDLGR